MSFPRHTTSFPRAIMHIDGDSFFASCEQSREVALRGKPVVTGQERGIASSMSLEAKALGITRAMPIREIKKRFPQVIVIPSDYETYTLLSARFMNIVRRYTPDVEEYGIDECFADLTGLRKTYRMSYEKICLKIQDELTRELNCTFSIGLAPSKTLAKVGSKWKKSGYSFSSDSRRLSGLTSIPARDIPLYLKDLPVGEVWNIGPQTTAFLQKCGIYTAYQFACKEESWVKHGMSINYYETWTELRGQSAKKLVLEQKPNTHSIQRVRTFTPPSRDKDFLLAKLTENIHTACKRARRHSTEARDISFFLKTQDFHYRSMRVRLSRPTAFSHEIISVISPLFAQLYMRGTLYRATGVTLSNLSPVNDRQMDLFGSHVYVEKIGRVYTSIDAIAHKYGKNSIHFGTSFLSTKRPTDTQEQRKVVTNHHKRKLGYPLLLGEFLLE